MIKQRYESDEELGTTLNITTEDLRKLREDVGFFSVVGDPWRKYIIDGIDAAVAHYDLPAKDRVLALQNTGVLIRGDVKCSESLACVTDLIYGEDHDPLTLPDEYVFTLPDEYIEPLPEAPSMLFDYGFCIAAGPVLEREDGGHQVPEATACWVDRGFYGDYYPNPNCRALYEALQDPTMKEHAMTHPSRPAEVVQ